ncbi:MAG: peptide chain release factor N(5)-glutamine methyltransferase [bacterium]|nr:peptide chain release factor N(5)-glutamine methyltransferase [bacterium]
MYYTKTISILDKSQPPMTISFALHTATKKLISKKIPMAYLDAELLLASVLKKDRVYVLAHGEKVLTTAQSAKFTTLIKKRAQRIPLAYIIGRKEFYGLPFHVSPNVLIPRPDTEKLITIVLDYLTNHPQSRILIDVGTGSGCIPLALATHTEQGIKIEATDISTKALSLAKKNVKLLKLESRVNFSKHDLLKGILKRYDIIISNLPYLSKKEYACAVKLFPEIKYEPHGALLAGKDGLDLIRILLMQASQYLKKNGVIFLEIGYEQGMQVTKIAHQHFSNADIQIIKDDCGKDRVAMIQT